MTENEAINVLKMVEAHGCLVIEAKVKAIQALEEIQAYRAIGTIVEFKALKEDKNFLEFLYNQITPNEMEQYQKKFRERQKGEG